MDGTKMMVHVEDVRPLIRQKGDLIRVTLTTRFTVEEWSKMGPLIGKHANVTIDPVSEEDAKDAETGQLQLEEGEDDGYHDDEEQES